ncbi:MAG: hypothetical protein HY343_00135 [Lentisphaerae bacterium]|nr:hypothetical protein [Lentisphaerota bacterium]
MINPQLQTALREMSGENWHIHTVFSPCADAEMVARDIVMTADRLGLRTIVLVDHHHPGKNDALTPILFLKASLSKIAHTVNVILGAELSAYGRNRYGEDIKTNRAIEYRLYACNHYHLREWEKPRKQTPAAYAEHSLDILRELIPSGRAACIAHPLLGSYLTGMLENPRQVTQAISDKNLEDMFALSKTHRVAWEISTRHLMTDPAFAWRFLHIGFEAGVDFRLGTDAHRLRDIDPKPQVADLITALQARGMEIKSQRCSCAAPPTRIPLFDPPRQESAPKAATLAPP